MLTLNEIALPTINPILCSQYSLKKVTEKEVYIKTLPPHHQMLLRSYLRHLEEQSLCIEHNAEIIKLIIRDVDSMFENQSQPAVSS